MTGVLHRAATSGSAPTSTPTPELPEDEVRRRADNLPLQLLRKKRFRLPFTSEWTSASPEEVAKKLPLGELQVKLGEEQYPIRNQSDFLALEEFLTEATDGPEIAHQLEAWQTQNLVIQEAGQTLQLYPAYLALEEGDRLELLSQDLPVALLGPENSAAEVDSNLERVRTIQAIEDPKQRVVEKYLYLVQLKLEPGEALSRLGDPWLKETVKSHSGEVLQQASRPVGELGFEQRLQVFASASQLDAEIADSIRDCLSIHGPRATAGLLKAGGGKSALEALRNWKPEISATPWADLIPGPDPEERADLLRALAPMTDTLEPKVARQLAVQTLEDQGETDQLLAQAARSAFFLSHGAEFEVAQLISGSSQAPSLEAARKSGLLQEKSVEVAAELVALLPHESPEDLARLFSGQEDRSRLLKDFRSVAGQGLVDAAQTLKKAKFHDEQLPRFLKSFAQVPPGFTPAQKFEAFEELGLLGSKGPLGFYDAKEVALQAWHREPQKTPELKRLLQEISGWEKPTSEASLEALKIIEEAPRLLERVEAVEKLRNLGCELTQALRLATDDSIEDSLTGFQDIRAQHPGKVTKSNPLVVSSFELYRTLHSEGQPADQVGELLSGLNLLAAKRPTEFEAEAPKIIAAVAAQPSLAQALPLLPFMGQRGYHFPRTVKALEMVAEPLPNTTPQQRIQAFSKLALREDTETPVTFYKVKNALFQLYRERVHQGQDPEQVANHLADFSRGLGIAVKSDREDEAAALELIRSVTEKKIPTALLGKWSQLKNFHYKHALSLMEKILEEVPNTNPEQRFEAFAAMNLIGGGRPLNWYSTKAALYQLYQQAVRSGESHQEAVQGLSQFSQGLIDGRSDEVENEKLVLEVLQIAGDKKLPSAVLGKLPQLENYHLKRSLGLLEKLHQGQSSEGEFEQHFTNFLNMGMVGAPKPLNRYVVKERLLSLYQNRVAAGEDSEQVAAALAGLMKGISQGLDRELKTDQPTLDMLQKIENEGISTAVLRAWSVFQDFHLERGLSFVKKIGEEIEGTTLDQRIEAFEQLGLVNATPPLRFYVVKEALYDLYRSQIEKGVSPQQALKKVKAFGDGLNSQQSNDQKAETLQERTLEFITRAVDRDLDLDALALLPRFTEERFHLRASMELIEKLARPIKGTQLEQRFEAFQAAGLLGGEGIAARYVVKNAGYGTLTTYLHRGMGLKRATAALARTVKNLTEGGKVEESEALAVLREAEKVPPPEEAEATLSRLRGAGLSALKTQELLSEIYRPGQLGARPEDRASVLFNLLDLTLGTGEEKKKVSGELAHQLLKAWGVLVGRGRVEHQEALGRLIGLLDKLDGGQSQSALGKAILDTIEMTTEEVIANTEIGYAEDHILIGDTAVPMFD